MKKKILSATLAIALLAGCSSTAGGNGSSSTTSEDLYYVFTSDLQTIDYMQSQNATENMVNTNLVDGLTEVNNVNQYVGALAESWESNDDKTEWTFHLREGVKWVTNTGEEYADVTADDFVAGLQHIADFKGATLYIAETFVEGLADYGNGASWDVVGVEAVDELTVKYTLTEPTPYFASVASYVPFWPINREFLEEQGQGCKLGSPVADDCGFGKPTDPSSILYNGAYILDEFVSKSSEKMHKNESYWDAENVHIQNISLVYDDGSDPASTVKGFEAETNHYYQATLLATSDNFEQYLEQYSDYAFSGQQNQYTFGINFNFNRITYNNSDKVNDTAAQDSAKAALLNTHFRRAIKFGLDRVAYLSTVIDSSIAEKAIRTIESPWNFVATSDGKAYGELVQEASQDPTIDLSEGQDSVYNPETAKAELELAKAELGDSVTYPIILDLLVDEAVQSSIAQAASLEQSIEASLGVENVDVVVHPVDEDTYYQSAYLSTGPVDADWDISTSTGWGYDYVDPKSYLNIFSPVNGDVLRQNMGLEYTGSDDSDEANENAIEASGLNEYQALLDEAYAITDDMDARYEAEAKAEAFLLDNAIAIPVQTQTASVNWRISRSVPFLAGYQSYKYKNMIIQSEPILASDYEAAYAQWQKDVAAAAAEAE